MRRVWGKALAKSYTFEAIGLLHQGIDESILNVVKLASTALDAPISHVSVLEINEGRQLIAGSIGPLFDPMSHNEMPLEDSICRYVLGTDQTITIPDLQDDPRTRDLELLREQSLRSYIGSPIHTTTGKVIGSLCCMTRAPREWSPRDIKILEGLALSIDDIIKARTVALEERKLRAKLHDIVASRTGYIAHIGHEIRTPLTGIIASIRMLNQSKSDDQVKRLTSLLTRSSDKLMAFVTDVLDLAKLDTGPSEALQEETCLVDFVEEIISDFSQLAASKKLTLDIDNRLGGMTYMIDQKAMTTVAQRLIRNAIKFTDRGHVKVRLAEDSYGQIVFEVSDTGIGISAADHQKIFSEFSQADPDHARIYGGSGLGMTIVKRSVELLDGTISIDSRPGDGAKFTVLLPLQCVDHPQKAA